MIDAFMRHYFGLSQKDFDEKFEDYKARFTLEELETMLLAYEEFKESNQIKKRIITDI